MPTDLVTRDDTREQNRRTLMVIFGVIALLVALSIVTILVKN